MHACETAPSKLLDLCTRADSVHSYNTRSASAGGLYTKHSRLKQQSHSFSRIGCKICNGRPEHPRTKNKISFKKCLQQTLLQLLEHEENYVDVHTLIQKILANMGQILICATQSLFNVAPLILTSSTLIGVLFSLK